MEYPKDVTGKQAKLGDKVKWEGKIIFHDGFKIDLTPVVTVREKENVLYFGGLSAKSFRRFWIVEST
jgi:hypothetical protein